MAWLVVLVLVGLSLAAAAFLLWYRAETAALDTLVRVGDGFTPVPLEIESYDLNDVGVADVDGDARLDIFTINHSARQSLLLNRGDFVFSEMFPRSGLSQTRRFPEVEDGATAPDMRDVGLYVYRRHRWLELRAVGLDKPIEGSIATNWPLVLRGNENGVVERRNTSSGSIVRFRLAGGQSLRIIGRQGIVEFPHHFALAVDTDLTKVFVGLERSNPPAGEFTLEWRDRHAYVWGELSGDGLPDVLVTRGGAKGQAARFDPPPEDELLFGEGGGRFADAPGTGGFVKAGCPARQTRRVDADSDGLLDVHIVCGRFGASDFPDQLWLQGPDGGYLESAAAAGLAAGDMSVGTWLDIDGDRDADYIAAQGQGLYLYRNAIGRFERIELDSGRERRVRSHAAADIDADGDTDVLSVGKRGSVLLENRAGELVARDPTSIGLPGKGESGSWIDVDNDGVVEFHDPVAGLYRRDASGRFEPSGELVYRRDPDRVYQASCTWFDADGDGAMDVLCGFVYRPARLAHWFEERLLGRSTSLRWAVELYRNESASGNWLHVDLRGPVGNREALGAKVSLVDSERVQTRWSGSAEGSLFSQGHYRMYFGLGEASAVDELRIEWPDGETDVHRDVPADRRYLIDRSGTIVAR